MVVVLAVGAKSGMIWQFALTLTLSRRTGEGTTDDRSAALFVLFLAWIKVIRTGAPFFVVTLPGFLRQRVKEYHANPPHP